MNKIDPYHLWFQIPPSEQPPNHYRLLGLVDFESDAEVIENAVEHRLIFLRSVQNGPNGVLAQQLSNEVAKARIVLLNAESKAAYDLTIQTPSPMLQQAGANQQKKQTTESAEFTKTTNSAKTTGTDHLLPQPSLTNPDTGNRSVPSIDLGIQEKTYKPRPLMASRQNWLLPTLIVGVILVVCTLGYIIVAFSNRPNEVEVTKKTSQPDSKPSSLEKKQPNQPPSQPSKNKSPQLKADSNSNDIQNPESIDLLSLIEFPKNLRQGAGELSATKLSLDSQTCINLVDFPVYLPSHYRLEAKVTRRSPNDGFGFGIQIAGYPCFLMLDGYPNSGFKTSIRQIVNPPNDKTPRTDIHTGQLLMQDQTHDISLIVKPTSAQLFVDQELRYSWNGDPSKLRPAPYILPGDSLYQLWLASWKTKFDIENLRLVPDPKNTSKQWHSNHTLTEPLTTVGPSIDLVDKFDRKSIIQLPIAKSNSEILIGPGLRAGVAIPHRLPLEFDLRMTVIKTGRDGFAFLPPYHDRRFAIMIDQVKNGKLRTGIQMVHRQYIYGGVHPGHLSEEVLEKNKPIELECRVRRDGIRLYKEGEFILGWSGGRNPIRAPDWNGYSVNKGKHFLRLASFSNQIRVTKLSFKEVTYRNRISLNNKRLKLIELNPALKLFQNAR